MKGYVKNKTTMWTHAMKRAIGPGGTVSLKELYKQYGKKHNLAEGQEFVTWLKTIKLTDTTRWEVVLEHDKSKAQKTKEIAAEAQAEAEEIKKEPTIKEMGVEDIVGLSVRRARELLPKMTDIKLLKYALQEASSGRAGKDSLCIMLRKRIQEIQIRR